MNYLIKEKNKFQILSNETKMIVEGLPDLIIIGGIVYAYLAWRKKSERLMRRYKVKYGDTVIQTTAENRHKIGEVIKRDGIPMVRTEQVYNGSRLFKWDETWKRYGG